MPKWWPWGRSKHPEPEPTAPATRPEAVWHRLPAVQRTVEDIEPTAHLQGFTASLTTSQNPGLTGSLDLLSAGHSDKLPVLDLGRHSAGAAARAAPTPAAPTSKSRTWAPSPMAVQRALFQSTATVQHAADRPAPTREIHSVDSVVPTDSPPHSMVEAPPPDDRRMLHVANDPAIGTDEPQSVDWIASIASQEIGTFDGTSSQVAEDRVCSAPSAPDAAGHAAQRVSSAMDSFPAAPEANSAALLAGTRTSPSTPLRHLPSVQRSVSDGRCAPEGFAGAQPIPVLRTIESLVGGQPPRSNPDATTAAISEGRTTLQHSTGPDPAGPHERKSASRAKRGSALGAVGTSSPVAGLQRLPVVEVRPVTSVGTYGPERQAAASPKVQRTPESDTGMGVDFPIHGDEPPEVSSGRYAQPPAGTSEATHELTHEGMHETTGWLNAVPDAAATQHSAAPTPLVGLVQRVSLPVVQPTPAPARGEFLPAPRHSDSSPGPAVQRVATRGRLMVLPPVRTNSDSADDAPGDSPGEPQRSLLFESPRPVGLQRMFERHTAEGPDRATDFASTGFPSSGFPPASFGSGSSYAGDNGSGGPDLEASGHSYDPSTNTLSFPSATIQRAPETTPASPEPAPTPAPAATVTSSPAATAPVPDGDVDELVNRLYDPLAARLRAELWLDRERAGVLMDLGR